MRFIALAVSGIALSVFGVCAQAQISTRANLVISDVQVVCQGTQPFASLTLPIGAADLGHPGLLYIGMHDPGMSQAAFFVNGNWVGYQGGLFPINTIASGGLYNVRMVIPLPPSLAGGGWKLYVGYGALSAAAESQVQATINAISAAKALKTDAALGAIDPNSYRRTLIQSDMTQAGKYGYVNTGVETNPYVCQPEFGGGGGE